MERINEKTPYGGDYSEAFFFDEDGNTTDKDNAVSFIIRECLNDGTLLAETFGIIKDQNLV